jgi:hypothetical protein
MRELHSEYDQAQFTHFEAVLFKDLVDPTLNGKTLGNSLASGRKSLECDLDHLECAP